MRVKTVIKLKKMMLSALLSIVFSAQIAASNLTWIPPIAEYINNEGLTSVPPEFVILPERDTDGYFDISWQGETSSFVVEIAPASSTSALQQKGLASRAKNISYSPLARALPQSDDWQRVYAGSDKQTRITDLPEGVYVFRVYGCEDVVCSEPETSSFVTVAYDLSPNFDHFYVNALQSTELKLLANDRDPTQPEVSIYEITSRINIYIPPRAGELHVDGTKVIYTNTESLCTTGNTFEDYFYYQIVDVNGYVSEPAAVTVEVHCTDTYYIPTWVEVQSQQQSSNEYRFFAGTDGYYLRAKASEWISLGFLTLPKYYDRDYLKLVNNSGTWIAQASNAAAFMQSQPLESSYAIAGQGSLNGNLALNIGFAGSQVIDISWPTGVVGQPVQADLVHPVEISCNIAEISTERYVAAGNAIRFYQPGNHKIEWQCDGSGTHQVGTLIEVQSLNAPASINIEEVQ